jgi:hypothetical protein
MASRRWLAVAGAAVVALTGCSSGSHPSAVASDPPGGNGSPTAQAQSAGSGSAAPTTEQSSQPSGHATTKPGVSGGSASPHGTASPTPRPTPTDVPLNARLAKSCVTPGSTQTLTVQARPAMSIIFDTLYSNGKEGQTYGGIDPHGRTDASGHYSNTWTVSPAAPPGNATVNVAGITDDDKGSGHQLLNFEVKPLC